VVLFAALIFPFVPPIQGATVTNFANAQSLGTRAVPSPGVSSVVPQSHGRRGQQGYNITRVPRLSPTSSAGQPFFRGVGTSKVSKATASASPRSTSTPLSPRFSVAGGLNHPGMTAAGQSTPATPPDSTGAIGPNNYVEMVNSSIAVYSRTNLTLVNSSTLDAFTGQPPGVPLCDPQIQWDPAAARWLFSILYCNTSSSVQLVVFGWSKTPDPTNLAAGWCQFQFANSPYILDYQKLGHNTNYMIIGGNLYNETNPSTNPPFVSAGIEWAQLPASSTDTSCTPPASSGGNQLPLKNGDATTLTFTPVPVNTDTSATDGYIASAYDVGGNVTGGTGPKTKVAFWHLDSGGVLHADNDVTVFSYDIPSSAPQPGTLDTIDTLDGRLTQAVGDPVRGFYTQHTVAGPAGRSAVNWYEFVVTGSTVMLAQEGQVSNASDWVFDAAISPRFDGFGAVIAYNRVSTVAGHFPVVAAQVRFASTAAGTMAPGELVLATSTAADTDFSCNNPTAGVPCRWGDYSGATPDPVQANLVWGTGEFNTAATSTPAWSDENFAIAPGADRPAMQSTPAGSAPARVGVNQSTTGTHPGR
jgi:hypothetical protein